MGEQNASLLTSLVLIFMVLLFQFKSIRKSLIIMAGIPMSWFGAFIGLFITGNPIQFYRISGSDKPFWPCCQKRNHTCRIRG